MMDALIKRLKRSEGLRLKPYKCPAGKWTIGYGHNLEAAGEEIPSSITIEQANAYLYADVARAKQQCELLIEGFLALDEVRQGVLVDMCFNMGINGLLKFKATLTYIKNGDYSKAADQMLKSLWAKQVGPRARELSKIMKEGVIEELD